ncbi:period circadian protein homolog 2 isoform 2-T2 [Molossus nigricans]
MNEFAGFAPKPSRPSKEAVEPTPSGVSLQEDVDMSSGSSGNETNENCSTGRDSQGSDCGDSGKELGMLGEPPATRDSPSAYSLMLAKSEHNPSTSGCSSEQSTKADAHRELIRTLKELKVHLPADRKAKGKASTLATLKYALRSVKQVKAHEEYYQLLVCSEKPSCGADVPSCTVDEVRSAASEFLVKSADMFAAAVSLVTGKILYISSQVASIFHCKQDAFQDAKFVEFLAPRDVSMFHSSTTPCKLPPWSLCNGADSFSPEYMEEKSFFCRVSVGKNAENEVRYHPFRMTPYLVKVREQQGAESQLCCVLLAERVHSGYEAPRIPPEKRIFTTTHTPNCLFQDVDERAVPLLGYLPQDLIETPVLLQLHPSDRPLMFAIHKKIMQSGGQPFDYSPLRFRTQNGEYVTLDTSWSSFINPWSRKISFIIGRHRVRVGPLNEDVFTPPCAEEQALHPSIQELTEQIHRLLLQPVPHSGSSGYGSLGSNGSHEHLMSQTSSSDSNGHEDARRRRAEISKNGNKIKTESHYSDESEEQKKNSATETRSGSPMQVTAAQAAGDSSGASPPAATFPEELACRNQPAGSYQQISCLDSVIRYLESCSEAATLKRKCEFPASASVQKASDKRKATGSPRPPPAEAAVPSGGSTRADVRARLASLTLPGKAESVVSLTSQCSYSSTIVHVGDKKPQPEPEAAEDPASGPESLDCLVGPALPCGLGQDQEPFRRLGLTKEVLAAHTQKEEQSFLLKLKEPRRGALQSRCRLLFRERPRGRPSGAAAPGLRCASGIEASWKKTGRNRKLKSRRVKPLDSSESTGSGGSVPHRRPLVGLNATAWSPSDTSQSSCPAMPFPAPLPAYSLPVLPAPAIVPAPGAVAAAPMEPHASFTVPAVPMDAQHEFAFQPLPFTAALAPVMALVLPSYPFPPVIPNLPTAFFPGQMTPASQPESPGRTSPPRQPSTCPRTECGPPASRGATPATPLSATGLSGRVSPPLFQSRGSSPLQLNLLQLEEAPEGSATATGAAGAGPDCRPGAPPGWLPKAPPSARIPRGSPPAAGGPTAPTRDEPSDAQNSDALSTSSDLLNLLLREDLCSATGSAQSGSGASATSDSLGSSSLGCDATRSRAGSSDVSHSSKYFGSIDSSDNSRKAEAKNREGSEHFIKHVLQDPVWLLMADTDDSVMMTYQMPARDVDAVLKEDREKLRLLQKLQPRFTERQKQELQEVHPWVRAGGLPAALDVAECVYCENKRKGNFCIPYEDDSPPLGLSEATDTTEKEPGPP